eukprot:TRINITY_DN9693_c0_g1_i1.p1 TRINITY_DN9693_c0_g1~~TRINITY_DN9693_c0_g1_i1.p1  ORF type:complete len:275 (+),score=45.58 TRINITY_DN9693_c0_g1_i1:130-954(+)
MVLEQAVLVAEVAEFAWNGYQRRSEGHMNALLRENEALAAEGSLARVKLENRKLQATLEEYRVALLDLQHRAACRKWLGDELSTPEGTLEIYEKLEKKVNSQEFLDALEFPPDIRGESASGRARCSSGNGYEINVTPEGSEEDPAGDWWLWVTDKDMYDVPREDSDTLDGSGYVVLDREDVIDGLANFIARFLLVHPDTKNMTPKQLQDAIVFALAELRVKSTFRRLWDWGKFFYTVGSWTAPVFSVFRNPLIVRATLLAIMTSSRVIMRVARV